VVLRAAIQQARERLIAAGIDADEAGLDAELLARHVLGWERATLVARLSEPVPLTFDAAFVPLVDRRRRREPMAYILGVQEFWGRDFRVAPGVLIPRPETELLVEEALGWAREHAPGGPPSLVDVGTGSGCVAVTLALELPRSTVAATDLSAAALEIAGDNARRLGAAVRFERGSLLTGVAGPLDVIVSNPPYVARADYLALQPEVRLFEPELALVGGVDGLEVIRRLVVEAERALRPGGRLLMEIGYGQAAAAARIVTDTERLTVLRIRNDLQGTPRTVVAVRGPD